MAKRKRARINWFDYLVLGAVVLVVIIYISSKGQQPYLGGQKILVKIISTDHFDNERALAAIKEMPKEVFYNGTKFPVEQIDYQILRDDPNNIQLMIYLLGPGDIRQPNREIFNGQRILINQKAEIRANYFIQGKVHSYAEYNPKSD